MSTGLQAKPDELRLMTDRMMSEYTAFNRRVSAMDGLTLEALGLPAITAISLYYVAHGADRPNRLAALMGQKTQTVVGSIDRLERAGLLERAVKRSLDSVDRRAVYLKLTAKGSAMAEAADRLMPDLLTAWLTTQ
jgi:DNA-binding MarR family transcriptional regulator